MISKRPISNGAVPLTQDERAEAVILKECAVRPGMYLKECTVRCDAERYLIYKERCVWPSFIQNPQIFYLDK